MIAGFKSIEIKKHATKPPATKVRKNNGLVDLIHHSTKTKHSTENTSVLVFTMVPSIPYHCTKSYPLFLDENHWLDDESNHSITQNWLIKSLEINEIGFLNGVQ